MTILTYAYTYMHIRMYLYAYTRLYAYYAHFWLTYIWAVLYK